MPLRKARPGEERELRRFLAREPLYNLFLIANLAEGLGPDLDVWVQDARAGRGPAGVLMRRRTNWILDAGPDPDAFDFAAAAGIMDGFPADQVLGLTGRPEAVDPVYNRLLRHSGQLYRQQFAFLPDAPASISYAGQPRPAHPDDLDAVAAIYADAGDMSRPRAAVQEMLPRLWVIEDAGLIACVGALHAMTDQAGMIGAVFTPSAFRQRGYASTLVHALSNAVVASGKRPCLFYHNPEAGRLYRRLGYQDLGPWRMVRFAASGAGG